MLTFLYATNSVLFYHESTKLLLDSTIVLITYNLV